MGLVRGKVFEGCTGYWRAAMGIGTFVDGRFGVWKGCDGGFIIVSWDCSQLLRLLTGVVKRIDLLRRVLFVW